MRFTDSERRAMLEYSYERRQNLDRFGVCELNDTVDAAVAKEISGLLTDEQAGNLSDMARKWLRYYERLNATSGRVGSSSLMAGGGGR